MRDIRLPVGAECICGAVRVEASAPPQGVLCCHCRTCQRISGTAYQHNAHFDPDKVSVVAGKGHLQTVDVPGDARRRCYCATCKAPVMHMMIGDDHETPTRTTLPVGAITSKASARDPAWAAEGHICYRERARDVPADVPKWPGADMDAQRWQPRDGPAAAAVPPDVAELPPLPAPPIAAVCLCGQTRVEACALPLWFLIYSSFVCASQLQSSDDCDLSNTDPLLRVTAGNANVTTYRKGASPRVTIRCGRCLSRMFRQQEAADGSIERQSLAVGMVDKAEGSADRTWQPRFHMFYSERAVDMGDTLPKWSGPPEKSERLDG